MKRISLGLSAALLSAALLGCAAGPRKAAEVSPSASQPWTPPAKAAEAKVVKPAYDIPAELAQKKWGLRDVLEVALANNPATRAAWNDAKAAAAREGIAGSAELPKVTASAGLNYRATDDSSKDFVSKQTSFAPALTLSWLLLDFGSRDASVESARSALLAANWTQNKVIQDTVLQTSRAYYLYLSTKALLSARQKNLERAETILKAAEARHEAGVATRADILSARTAVSQAKLALQTVEGQIATTRGGLASAMGLPANLPFDIEELPGTIPFDSIAKNVDSLIEEALDRRPDLFAAREQAKAASAQVTKAKGDGLPTLSLNASTGVTWYDVNESKKNTAADRREDSFSVGLLLQYPLFTGYYDTYNVERARAEAESAKERERGLAQQIIFQVYSGYYTLVTAGEKVKTSDDLLASAQEAEEVALGRYQEGVGTIVDLLTAQTALSDARSQGVQTRWEWYTSLSQLAHDTGLLGLHGESEL
jgi:TolC family type I secretion outer membrane protein